MFKLGIELFDSILIDNQGFIEKVLANQNPFIAT